MSDKQKRGGGGKAGIIVVLCSLVVIAVGAFLFLKATYIDPIIDPMKEVAVLTPSSPLTPSPVPVPSPVTQPTAPTPPVPPVPPPPTVETKSPIGLSKQELTFFKTLKNKGNDVGLKTKQTLAVSPKKKKSASKTKSLTSTGKYTIQMAAYAEKKRADALSKRLKNKGIHAYVVVGHLPEKGVMYRVRVGQYKNREMAEKAAAEIQRTERSKFFVTTE